MFAVTRRHLVAFLFSVLWLPATHAEDLTIAVASNFTSTAKQLAGEFERQSNHHIKLAFGSTGAHYAQISHGAPFDIFFAADVKTPARLESDGKIVAGSRFTYAQGQLVLWSPKAGVVDSDGKMLTAGKFDHLAIANAKLAPYGQAAEETLQHLQLLDTVQAKLVRGENIGQTYQFVYSGAAQLGFVALAQVMNSDGSGNISGSYWIVPQPLYSPIEQQVVLLKDSQAARDFLAFVHSAAGKKIIRAYGYSVPD